MIETTGNDKQAGQAHRISNKLTVWLLRIYGLKDYVVCWYECYKNIPGPKCFAKTGALGVMQWNAQADPYRKVP